MSDTPVYDHNNPYQVPHIDYPNLSSVNEITGQRMTTKALQRRILITMMLFFVRKKKSRRRKGTNY